MTRLWRPRAKGYVKLQEARYVELTLQTGSAAAKKQALQGLCGLLRAGFILAAPMVTKGLILQCLSDQDPKVSRWAFNALAQLGSENDVPIIMPCLEAVRPQTEVFEAGLTALAHILPKERLTPLLSAWGVPMSSSTVMALAQQSSEYASELASVSLNLDSASAAELRSATLIVGLRKAPESLFSEYHPVASVIGVLNTHEDPIVAQYSYWAAVENPEIGLDQMRVQPADFSRLPPNARGWALRLLTKDPIAARAHYEVIVEASQSVDFAEREGLAFGIRDLYYDSLDATVIDWYLDPTEDETIKELLLVHMSAQAVHSGGYREQVVHAYRETGPGSRRRARLEAVCGSQDLSLVLRGIELQTDDPDLFYHLARPSMTTNNNQTINAQTVTGVSGSGTGNIGDVTIYNRMEAQAKVASSLAKLDEDLKAAGPSQAAKEGEAAVAAAREVPTRSNMERVLDWLKLVKAGGDALSSAMKSADTVSAEIHHLIPHLPSHF